MLFIRENDQTFLLIDSLLSSLETYNRNLITTELNLSMIQPNLAVSIVNQPNNRSEPIIGFVYGKIKASPV